MIKRFKKHKREYELGLIGASTSLVLYYLLRYIAAPVVKKLWVKDVEGLDNIPKKGPVIIASNHESYMDFLCFWAVAPRQVQYLAAEVFYKKKMWKPIMVATGQIKVERDSRDKKGVHEKAHYILENDGMLGVFPEGTRTRTGDMGKAYTGVAKFALKGKAPIVPVGMVDTFNIWPPHKKLPRFKKCRIKIDKPIHFTDYHDKEHTEELIRHLTDELMSVIAGLVGKKYGHHYKLNKHKQKNVEMSEIKNIDSAHKKNIEPIKA